MGTTISLSWNKKLEQEKGIYERTVTINSETESYTIDAFRPNMKWRHKCGCGRIHKFGTKKQNYALLSLRRIEYPAYDEYFENTYMLIRRECVECGAVIEPRYKTEEETYHVVNKKRCEITFSTTDTTPKDIHEKIDLAEYFPEIFKSGMGIFNSLTWSESHIEAAGIAQDYEFLNQEQKG